MPSNKRKVISCSTCRRLRTRCEKITGIDVCRRCDRLRIACSFPVIACSASPGQTPTQNARGSTDVGIPCVANADIHQRILAIETSLAEVRGLLTASASSTNDPTALSSTKAPGAPSPSSSTCSVSEDVASSQTAEAFAQTAPISVVRNMKHIILGTSPGPSSNEPWADCVTMGLIPESLYRSLFDGLSSLPLQRYGLDRDPWEIRSASPLLFATCLLVGLYTIPTLCNSQLHLGLYTHVEGLASEALLRSPLPIESVQAFLMLSTWHLVPQQKDRYIDSWLMSGMGIMHGMLSIDFEKQSAPLDLERKREIRTWNALCLTHLQFSVGTGCPPIMGEERIYEYLTKQPADDRWDQILIAQSKLYCTIYGLVTSKKISAATIENGEIGRWKHDHNSLIESDTSLSLAFAHTCACLILSRHLLKTVTSCSPPALLGLSLTPDDVAARTESLVRQALESSFQIMKTYLSMTSMEGNVAPAFNRMMCSNAAITVIEFKQRLNNTGDTWALMQSLDRSIREGGSEDEVFGWAANVMKMAASEGNGF